MAETVVCAPIPEPYCAAPRDGQKDRNLAVDIVSGLLVSGAGRWYPIIENVPEILPDRLRDWPRDLAFLETLQLPEYLRTQFVERASKADKTAVAGDNFKHSEINLLNLVEDRNLFTGPGLLSPFNPYAFHHSSELLRGFACAVPFMKLQQGAVVLDSGSGYCWITEWFMKMGIRAVGVEINREYVQVGRRRMGLNQPEIVIADAENLPFKPGVFDAVLGFDAFHHIPNREHAMGQFARVMKSGATITLVEPGEAHEDDPVSREVMAKYGNLERGMNLTDVKAYVAGLPYGAPEELFLQTVTASAPKFTGEPSRDFIGWSLFTIARK